MRLHSILTSSAVLAALCSTLMGGCGGGTQLDDGSDPALRNGELSGAPDKDKGQGTKITICHVPPGNPDNAHTLIVGAPAWGGHSHHPLDYQGPCGGGEPPAPDAGTPPPPPDAGTPPPPPPPECAPSGASCGGEVVCCSGLVCSEGYCQEIIN